MKKNTYTRLASLMTLVFLFTFNLKAQEPVAFFNENFNSGIPSTWTSTGTSAKFESCNAACLQDYDQYSAGFFSAVGAADGNANTPNSIPWSTFKAGTVALKAVQQVNVDASLSSPAINCSGKNKVFIRFSTVLWGGANLDALQTSANASRTCLLRASKDGTTWKEYKISNFNLRNILGAFIDISEIAANQSQVYLQFRRTGLENNQIWLVDDVSLFDKAPLRNVTVSVDMSNRPLSSTGVFIANDLSGSWKIDAVKMTHMGNRIYQGTMQVPLLSTVHYKFYNGSKWNKGENVPIDCGERNAAGAYERVVTVTDKDLALDPVCFGACMACGNRVPEQWCHYACPSEPNVIYCENFETLNYGKLLPQSDNWTTFNKMLGTPISSLNDNPKITSYSRGFTNYDGEKALRIKLDRDGYDTPMMLFNGAEEGLFQLDFNIYVPKGKGGYMAFVDSIGIPGFTLNFAPDSLYFSPYQDLETFEPVFFGKATTYKQNNWNKISIVFNAATKKITVKLNKSTVFEGIDEAQGSISFLDIEALNLVGEFFETSELFIDDIVYSALPEAQPLEKPLKEELNPAFGTVSPNPASEKLTITPDSKTENAWQVQVLNSFGQVVSTQKSTGTTPLEMNIHDLNAGVYVLEFQSNNTRWTKKVVIQH
jgi:hypothetical protein